MAKTTGVRNYAYQNDKNNAVKNWANGIWVAPTEEEEKNKTGLMWKQNQSTTNNSSGTSTATAPKTTTNATGAVTNTSSGTSGTSTTGLTKPTGIRDISSEIIGTSGTGTANTSSVMLNPSAGLTNDSQKQTTNTVTQNPVVTTQAAWKSNSKSRGGTLVSSNKNTVSSQNNVLDSATDTTLNNASTGTLIKNKVKEEILNRYGYINNRHLFDDIDDETIEKNISVAERAIKTNIATGRLDKDYEKKYPNMKPGMTLFYAAMDKNKSKDAKAARDVAYSEGEPETKLSFYEDYLKKKELDQDTSENNPLLQNYSSGDIFLSPPSTFSSYLKMHQKNKEAQIQSSPEHIVAYYGHIDPEQRDIDLECGTYTDEDLKHVDGIKDKDLKLSEEEHLKRWKDLAKLTSMGKMQGEVINLIDHFANGTGTDYSSSALTKAVSDHTVTKEYMKDFTKVFDEQLQLHNGDISAFANSKSFRDALKDDEVLLSQYDYYGPDDIFGGLTMAIHSWTESEVEVAEYNVESDGTYTGMLKFTFKDNFGLDPDDVKKFQIFSGFRSWFILQHSKEYQDKYKPFKTIVEIYYPISGKIKEYKE